MIPLSDLLEQLKWGELYNTSLTGIDSPLKEIQPKDYPQLSSYITLGLNALHERFTLRYGEVTIQLYGQIAKYYFRSQFAQTNTESTEPIKYIIDSEYAPFKDDVIRVLSIYDEIGNELPLNDEGSACSIYTPTYDSIQVLNPVDTNVVVASYQAKHPVVKFDMNTNIDTIMLDIPEYVLKPLLYFIGSRFYSSMAVSSETNDGAIYNAMYENACNAITLHGLVPKDYNDNVKFSMNGWV